MQELSSRQLQIIDVSIHLISEGGIQELTMKNLSRELGISEPAIYRHFDNKQKILITMLESFKHQNKLINKSNAFKELTGIQHLQGIITGVFQKFIENPAISAVIFSEGIFQNESELAEMIQDIMNTNIGFFKKLIQDGQADKSIRSDIGSEELSIIVMGSVRHLVTVWRLSGFSFNLLESGKRLLKSLEVMMST